VNDLSLASMPGIDNGRKKTKKPRFHRERIGFKVSGER
jgi:hypothetical protein